MTEPPKLFYGVKKIPKGYKRANMKEAVEANKYLWWGINKIDKKLLDNKEALQEQKKLKLNETKIRGKIISLKVTINKLKEQYEQKNDLNIIKQYEQNVALYNKYIRMLKVLKEGKPVKEKPVKELPKKRGRPTKEKPAKELPKKRGRPTKEKPAKELSAKELSAKELPKEEKQLTFQQRRALEMRKEREKYDELAKIEDENDSSSDESTNSSSDESTNSSSEEEEETEIEKEIKELHQAYITRNNEKYNDILENFKYLLIQIKTPEFKPIEIKNKSIIDILNKLLVLEDLMKDFKNDNDKKKYYELANEYNNYVNLFKKKYYTPEFIKKGTSGTRETIDTLQKNLKKEVKNVEQAITKTKEKIKNTNNKQLKEKEKKIENKIKTIKKDIKEKEDMTKKIKKTKVTPTNKLLINELKDKIKNMLIKYKKDIQTTKKQNKQVFAEYDKNINKVRYTISQGIKREGNKYRRLIADEEGWYSSSSDEEDIDSDFENSTINIISKYKILQNIKTKEKFLKEKENYMYMVNEIKPYLRQLKTLDNKVMKIIPIEFLKKDMSIGAVLNKIDLYKKLCEDFKGYFEKSKSIEDKEKYNEYANIYNNNVKLFKEKYENPIFSK